MNQNSDWQLVLLQDLVLATIIEGWPIIESSARTDIYLSLLSSIISQQLSTRVASVIKSRFLNLFPEQYPHPELLQTLPDETLRGVGLSYQKLNYIRNVAAFKETGQLEHAFVNALEDEALITHLTQIKGVGRWTVEMILMFALDRPDVFPVLDLGIQNAMKKAYGLETSGKILFAQMREIAENWRPYRTIACKYLWKSLDS
ncbi:DNA-3-methyladenine glycosylase family protein [Adhaeribacter radiodurans]|uniref:DNA-3-methyladenine glycosylase II n=1 Tax=Adhaeribacter radiodurans TaxID=2745197 RepID=A0A7L7L6T7_9BACT|nr:DNA-3-methyladenine glycosylase 2 family protein [Adhaeribacter radiodurans]QMU28520.1 DNA-3-methyladenine glycosylase 2 family protein [Adhaeribacter radiodurans]